jgi:hypothetical protein
MALITVFCQPLFVEALLGLQALKDFFVNDTRTAVLLLLLQYHESCAKAND